MLLISVFCFESIQTNKIFYIPLGCLNILLGILFSQFSWSMFTGKDFILNNSYLKISNLDIFIKNSTFLKDSKNHLSSYINSYNNPTKDVELASLKESLKIALEKHAILQEKMILLSSQPTHSTIVVANGSSNTYLYLSHVYWSY